VPSIGIVTTLEMARAGRQIGLGRTAGLRG